MPIFLDPEEILKKVNLTEDMFAAEFGSGSGVFSVSLAKKLEKGKIYALDIQDQPLSALRGRAAQQKVFNIETIRCDLEKEGGSGLRDNYLDLVFIPNLLFQTENKSAIIKEAERVLKKGGKIVIVEWRPGASFGPKGDRVPPRIIKEIAKELGLELEKEFEAGAYHYGLIFIKP